MILIIKTFIVFTFINFFVNIQVISSSSIESHLVDDKNINWMGAIFKRSSKFDSFKYKCQGIFVDPKLIYTVDQCVEALEPVEHIRVRVYKSSGGNNTEATDFEEREVEGIGWMRLYLFSSVPPMPVRKVTYLSLKTPFDLQLNVEFPTKNNLKYDVAKNVDVNSCFFTTLLYKNNGFEVKQSKARYITSKEACCDKNGNHVCTLCNAGRKVFCAEPVEAVMESFNQKESLASSLACKSKSNNAIFVVGISVNNTECAPKFTTF
uniref:Venom protein Ci-40c n=1 Tax=Chelonus inanitus TaxID=49201 RepID=E6ZCK0_9HYME|nr:venom protein Ci-40c [Chelonus inanitus]